MQLLVIGVLTYVAFVLRTVLPTAGTWGTYLPRADLALLLLIACRTTGTTGLLTAAAWGLLSDALSRGALGIDVLSFVLVAYGAQSMTARGWMQTPLLSGAAAGAAVLATSAASALLRFPANERMPVSFDLITAIGGPALTTAILVFIVSEAWFWIVGRPSGGPLSSSPQVANRWHMLTD